ncbi:hypothetical protein OUZ56_024080 [Daphnia magna]|uniref:Chromo domain-containing protein n=1 Tax=Daphnia magna TaxID=35525 RepID=A0ABR0B028_9CRUS|nr:hypothetical protein OUZ56_024080 [Daphnia magna]
MPRNHQVQETEQFEEFKVMLSENGRNKVQYLLKYVGYDTPEWTDSSNCTNFSHSLGNSSVMEVDQAGPSDDYGEVEQDGEALLYCEAWMPDTTDKSST